MKIDTQSPAVSRTPPPAAAERNALASKNLAVDGRFKPFNVNHTDSRGREGMYVDQSSSFKALPGADGKPKAVAYTAGFAVDTDGVGSHHGDKTADDKTSLKVGGRSADADKLPYVALPPGLAKSMGAKLGDLVQVTAPNGKTAYGIYADNSDDRPGRKLGEGSPALLSALGYKGSTLDPNKGGLDSGVKFVAFPGSGDAMGTVAKGFPSSDQVQAMGKQWAARVDGGASASTSTPTNRPPVPGNSDGMLPPVKSSGPASTQATAYTPAPAMTDVASGKALLQKGEQGDSVQQLQKLLGMKGSAVDGQFGPDTDKAVRGFQQAHGLEVDGKVGTHTLAALKQGSSSGETGGAGGTTGPRSGPVLGNGVRIDTNNPILQKLANAPLKDGPTGYCVLTTLNNMKRLDIPHTPDATGQDPNNPRGGMAQMLRNGGWASVPFPGAHQESIRSPYGNTTANVVSADQYRKLVADGKVPSGAIIFQSRHGWDWNAGSKGNDMGIVRDQGRQTHNFKSMNSIIYSDCKSVVILVPKDALKTT